MEITIQELQEIKDYLRVDFEDDDNQIKNLILTAQIFIDSMVGENYKKDNKALNLSKLLLKKLVADMYENRGTTISNKIKTDQITTSILDKLSNY